MSKLSQKICELRAKVPEIVKFPCYDNDLQLQSWLKGYQNDFDTIVAKLRRYLTIRSSFHFEQFDKEKFDPNVKKYFPFQFFGTEDKEGNLLHIEHWGNFDLPGLKNLVCSGEFYRTRSLQTEFLRLQVLKQQEKLRKSVGISMILDLDEMDKIAFYNAIPLCGNAFTDHLQEFLEFHPGIFAKIFVVNAPSWFSLAFRLIKRVLPTDTQEKLHVMNGNFRPKLLKHFQPDQLPVSYGGTLDQAKDRGCPGGKVPETLYYSPERDRVLCEEAENLFTITIRAGTTEKIIIKCEAPGSVRYWFRPENGEQMKFSVHLEATDGKRHVLFPSLRVCTFNVPEVGQLKCPEAGLVVLEFTNENNSWFGSNITLQYFVEMLI